MTTYQAVIGKETRLTFAGNFAEASSPLTIDGTSTPFQVADARHRPATAAKLLNDWCRSQGGEAWGEDEADDVEVVAVNFPVLGEFGLSRNRVVEVLLIPGSEAKIKSLWSALDDADAVEQDEIFAKLNSLGAVRDAE
jgi:hypothetical protein